MSSPDPYSPEWTVYWTLKKAFGALIKRKSEYLAHTAAEQVVKDLRQSNWRLIRGLPRSAHGGSPASTKLDEERRLAFEAKVRELEAMSESNPPPSSHQGKLDV